MYPGQFPALKFNLFNIVLAVDLSKLSSTNFIAVTVQSLINRGLAFRWGVAPIVETEDGARMARLFYHILENFGSAETFAFFYHVRTSLPACYTRPDLYQVSQSDPARETVDWTITRATYNAILARKPDLPDDVERDFDEILAGSAGDLEPLRAYAARLSTDLASAPDGHAFFNGKHYELDDVCLLPSMRETDR